MFFKRKKKQAGEDRSDLRRHYRRAPGKKHALSAKLRCENQDPVAGELIDLSAGGAGVLFTGDRDPDLDPKQPVQLSFTSLVHGGEVVVDALVTSGRDAEEGGRRYGFQFEDAEGLFRQLDTYYFKFFNRRRAMRVRPELGKKLRATLAFGPGAMDVSLTNFSADGFGIAMTPEKAGMLEGVEEVTCTFKLPKLEEPICWPARAVHLTPLASGVLFGAVFLISDEEAMGPNRQALVDYCAGRAAEMALWDQHAE